MKFYKHAIPLMASMFLALALTGCPQGPSAEYNTGFDDGFMTDSKYWQGYDDSYNTLPEEPLLYSGSDIPYLEDDSYDAGYWDGIWYAYNDGYFVCYDYAFTIGFSEGYDIAFFPDWIAFLSADVHPEYLDGSFEDGYNDGFSEGSVFGAFDYKTGLPFDWEDAMWDYRAGTDIFLDEVGFGTGDGGNVYLYEYGVDPATYYTDKRMGSVPLSIRRPLKQDPNGKIKRFSPRTGLPVPVSSPEKAEESTHEISYRDLTPEVRGQLDQKPDHARRPSDRTLTLETTWLERVNAYRNASK